MPVDPLVMGEGVEGEAVMAEEQFSGPGGEDRTGSDLPVSGLAVETASHEEDRMETHCLPLPAAWWS